MSLWKTVFQDLARIFTSGEKIWLIAAAGCTAGLIVIAISYFGYGKRH